MLIILIIRGLLVFHHFLVTRVLSIDLLSSDVFIEVAPHTLVGLISVLMVLLSRSCTGLLELAHHRRIASILHTHGVLVHILHILLLSHSCSLVHPVHHCGHSARKL